MQLLEFSQITFNLIASLAIIVVTVLIGVIAYDAIKFINATKKFMDTIGKESSQLYGKINNFLEGIFNLSFFSRFFKKGRKKK